MTEIRHDDIEALGSLLVGRSVVQVGDGTLRLDDGRVLRLVGNPGCGGCISGNYDLTALNEHPVNAIMDVQVTHEPVPTSSPDTPVTMYRLFVLAHDQRIELASFEGTDGNGWYGTGFAVFVEDPT